MAPTTSTPSAIADRFDDGTAIKDLDVADYTSPINHGGSDKATKDKASTSMETNKGGIHTEIEANAGTEQRSDRATTVSDLT